MIRKIFEGYLKLDTLRSLDDELIKDLKGRRCRLYIECDIPRKSKNPQECTLKISRETRDLMKDFCKMRNVKYDTGLDLLLSHFLVWEEDVEDLRE